VPRKLSRGVQYPGITCPFCGEVLDHATLQTGTIACPRCGRSFEAVRFDPPQRDPQVAAVGVGGPGGATSCATHRSNAAVANCGRCGVFMCGLCRIDTDGLVLCPACFDRLSAEGALPSAVVKYRDYSRLASTLAIASWLPIFIGPVAGPAAILYGVKGLRQKREMGDTDGVVGVWVAMVLGGLAAVGWIVLLVAMVRAS
jgi:hypothetical protein